MTIFCGLPEDLFLCCGGKNEEEPISIVTEEEETPKKKKFFRRSNASTNSSPASVPVLESTPVEKKKKDVKHGKRKPFRLWRRVDSNNTTSTVNDDEELELHVEEVLSTLFPTMTEMEIKRFSRNRSLEKARKKSTAYLNWRKLYDLDSSSFRKNAKLSSDWDIWNAAVVHAANNFEGKTLNLNSNLPRIVRFGEVHDLLAADGRRMVQVYPGMIDADIAPLEFYALCFAIYIDLKLDRNSDETVHVLIDTRHGKGWTNTPAMSLIPFVKSLVKNLEENMPERMFTCILYPLRPACKPIWTIFKGFLHQKVVDKIRIYWGPATPDSPIPKGMVNKAFTKKVVENLEQCRRRELELCSQHIS